MEKEPGRCGAFQGEGTGAPKQYQIFHYYVVKQWEAKRVQQHLGVSMAQVYLAKHRVGGMMKKEIEVLREQEF